MPATHTAAKTSLSAVKIVGSLTPNSVSKLRTAASSKVNDVNYGGKYRVRGTLKVSGLPNAPTHRQLRLIRDRDGACIRETWSDATTGAYSFEYLANDTKYTVLGIDYTHTFRAVVADNITPELMP